MDTDPDPTVTPSLSKKPRAGKVEDEQDEAGPSSAPGSSPPPSEPALPTPEVKEVTKGVETINLEAPASTSISPAPTESTELPELPKSPPTEQETTEEVAEPEVAPKVETNVEETTEAQEEETTAETSAETSTDPEPKVDLETPPSTKESQTDNSEVSAVNAELATSLGTTSTGESVDSKVSQEPEVKEG